MYREASLTKDVTLWRSRGSGCSVVPADGCVDLILRDDDVDVAGPSTSWIATRADGEHQTIGIRFSPGTATAVLPLALARISDQVAPLDDFVDRARATGMREALIQIREAGDSTSFMRTLEDARETDHAWTNAVRRLAARGVAAHSAATSMGWSERTLRRQMIAQFGYGYATLARIQRAERAHALLGSGVAIAEVAARTGYADQPHLSREFRRLVGLSPGQLAASSA